jgi:hypothetical protein
MYGYAAFGLTVALYTVMALVNLVSNLVSATYPNLYLVETLIMREAIDRRGKFVGVVGSLRPSDLPPECGPYPTLAAYRLNLMEMTGKWDVLLSNRN